MNQSIVGAATSPGLPLMPVLEVQVCPESRIFYYTEPHSSAADRFRYLRMILGELWNAGKLKSLLITSPLPQDGKTTIALNLATALADRGKRSVLLIEGDLHQPTVGDRLGLPRRPGLAECLGDGADPLSLIRKLQPLGWYLLPAGYPDRNPTELLQAEMISSVLARVSPLFDWVLIDSPPVAPLTDALSLARQTSATLLTVRDGRTPRRAVEKAVALLGRQRVLGVVFNGVKGLDHLYSAYYGGSLRPS